MVETTNLQFSYPEGKSFAYPDLYCATGENLLVLGSSGCGKTTLLHLLAGLLHPKSGSIKVLGQELVSMSERDKDLFRGDNVGMVFQKNLFLQGLSVWENLVAAQQFARKPLDVKYLKDICKMLGISDLLNTKPHRLSQGEQQRFSIARALANKPSILLADEPTSHLDDLLCKSFVDVLKEISASYSLCQMVVSHDQRLKNHFRNVYQL